MSVRYLLLTILLACGNSEAPPVLGGFQSPCTSEDSCEAPLSCDEGNCQGLGVLHGQLEVTSVSIADVELPAVATFVLTADSDPVVRCGAGYELAEQTVTEWPAPYALDGLPTGDWLLRVYMPSVREDRVASDEVVIQSDAETFRVDGTPTAEWNFTIYGGTVYECTN